MDVSKGRDLAERKDREKEEKKKKRCENIQDLPKLKKEKSRENKEREEHGAWCAKCEAGGSPAGPRTEKKVRNSKKGDSVIDTCGMYNILIDARHPKSAIWRKGYMGHGYTDTVTECCLPYKIKKRMVWLARSMVYFSIAIVFFYFFSIYMLTRLARNWRETSAMTAETT